MRIVLRCGVPWQPELHLIVAPARDLRGARAPAVAQSDRSDRAAPAAAGRGRPWCVDRALGDWPHHAGAVPEHGARLERSWSALQIAIALSLIAAPSRRTVGLPRALDLFFASHAPWSLWFLAAAAWGMSPLGCWSTPLLFLALAPIVLTPRMIAAFFREVLELDPRHAIGAYCRASGDYLDVVPSSGRIRRGDLAAYRRVARLRIGRRGGRLVRGARRHRAPRFHRSGPAARAPQARALYRARRGLPRAQLSGRWRADAVGHRGRGPAPPSRRRRPDQSQRDAVVVADGAARAAAGRRDADSRRRVDLRAAITSRRSACARPCRGGSPWRRSAAGVQAQGGVAIAAHPVPPIDGRLRQRGARRAGRHRGRASADA